MRKYLLFRSSLILSASLFLAFHSYGQTKIDSLQTSLKQARQDTVALNILIKLCREYNVVGDYKRSKEYADSALSLSEKSLKEANTSSLNYILTLKKYKADALNRLGHFSFTSQGNDSIALYYYRAALNIVEQTVDKKTEGEIGRIGEMEFPALSQNISPTLLQSVGDAYNGVAEIYFYKGRNAEALQYSNRSLKIQEQLGDKSGASITHNWMAVIYELQGNYADALKNVLTALKISEDAGDKIGIADCYGIMGNIFDSQSNYTEALKNYSAALKIEQEIGSKQGIANAYQAIGVDYSKTGNYDEALKNELAAQSLFEEIGNKQFVAGCYDDVGMIYRKQGNYKDALERHFAALKIYEETGNRIYVAESYTNIAKAYAGMNNNKEALQWLDKALSAATILHSGEGVKDIYKVYSAIYENQKDFVSAYKYQSLYSDLKDSLLNEKINMQMAEMRTIYETEKKDDEIALLNSQNKVKEEEVKKQKIIKYGAFSLVAVIALLAMVFINNMRIRYRAAQIIQRNEVRQKISRDLHDEIGAGLTAISMICERAKMEISSEHYSKAAILADGKRAASETAGIKSASDKTEAALEKIRSQSRTVSEKLREVVWATNPANDNLDVLLSYMRNYISNFFDNSSIAYSLDMTDDVPAINLKPDVSRNLIFILKEALNNIAKHSQAANVDVIFHLHSNKNYSFQIADDGRGLDYSKMPEYHNGLSNLIKRAEEINAVLQIKSEAGKGTRIELEGNLS